MSTNDDDFAVHNENGAVIATLWCEMVGEPTFDVPCPSCGDDIAIIADYAMGFGMTITGITRRFACACGASHELPCDVVLKDRPDYDD
jgi:hypothetical protein